MKVGRPTLRTPELVDEFCSRVASGRSIMSVCNDNDMPESGTIYRWRHECLVRNGRTRRRMLGRRPRR